jgi:hypothetical protein
MASRFDRIGLYPYLRGAARAERPAPCFATRGLSRRCGFKPVGPPLRNPSEWHVVAAVGQQEGAILSHFSKSEDANDQAP